MPVLMRCWWCKSISGYVSDDALVAGAEYLEMSPTEPGGIATFYNLNYPRKACGQKCDWSM